MITDKKVEELIAAQIRNREKLGNQAGGSGHMAHVSYRIDEIRQGILVSGITEITYYYTLIVETEFTCYPDNPPYEYPSSGTIRLDQEGNVRAEDA